MNMIPLVRATEPGRAQYVNQDPRVPNCSLDKHHQCRSGRKSFWKNASERVRIPYFLRSDPGAFGVLFRVAYFGSGAQNGWQLPSKAKYRLETDSKQVP